MRRKKNIENEKNAHVENPGEKHQVKQDEVGHENQQKEPENQEVKAE